MNYTALETVNRDAVTFSPVGAHTTDLSRAIDAQEHIDDKGYVVEFRIPDKVTVMNRKGTVLPSPTMINSLHYISIAVNEDKQNAPSALILRDSYTNFMHPYFNQTFSKSIYVPHGIYISVAPESVTDMPELTEEFAPDIVILLVMDSFISLPLP